MDFQNDIFEVQAIGTMQGQPIFNVFHFVRESIGASPASAEVVANAWLAKFNAVWLDMFPAGYQQESIRAQRIIRGDTDAFSRLPPAQAPSILVGTRPGESNTACQHIWVSYFTEVIDPDTFFQGGTALTAGVELDITDGSISVSLRDTIATWANLMKLPFVPLPSDDSLQWSIFSLKAQKAATPPIAIMVDTFEIRTNVSATERRRKGTSRGGFQPGGN